jgi:hypothetical protein
MPSLGTDMVTTRERRSIFAACLCAATLTAISVSDAQAATDTPGGLLGTFTGAPDAALDILSFDARIAGPIVRLSSVQAGAVAASSGFYVWG